MSRAQPDMSARKQLEDRARELCCFPDPENYTDVQLWDAIKCELAATGWMQKYEALPTAEARMDAIHRLRLSLERDH
jgi:hypothetical protein